MEVHLRFHQGDRFSHSSKESFRSNDELAKVFRRGQTPQVHSILRGIGLHQGMSLRHLKTLTLFVRAILATHVTHVLKRIKVTIVDVSTFALLVVTKYRIVLCLLETFNRRPEETDNTNGFVKKLFEPYEIATWHRLNTGACEIFVVLMHAFFSKHASPSQSLRTLHTQFRHPNHETRIEMM